jgi:hypothetical protein
VSFVITIISTDMLTTSKVMVISKDFLLFIVGSLLFLLFLFFPNFITNLFEYVVIFFQFC